jgi:hypothetical protein
MIGMRLHHPQSGITGSLDAQTVQPGGKGIVRIDDHWFEACDLGV